ncbi:MAG: molybdopterin-dependent oxidoreductase [Cryobacterium sp.]|uniref:molybdopterin-dependent oxidoreductase n=1 Tax=unclassified Cryobacterium TaxID=2649013 RepID=UPI0018C92289|nr:MULTISPECIES: molybdopterin-dependent oxidoreductase [unclassified Cryobacterium]MCY7405275.1 molybdopterin-dependent oxidoreductase [Cryobacterium sp.]MEC5153134.1 DMSO/TMAO reductase YedYZ molybdopterin-dependent catalytic subunit [Cryobacterium sp. CAN_C3]
MSIPDPSNTLTRPRAPTVVRPWRPACAGLAAALSGLGLAELTAAWIAPGASPVLTVGALVIDIVPAGVKDLVIGLFGSNDKIVLIVTIVLVLLVLAALAGILESRRPPFGRLLVVLIGAIALFAALSRSSASTLDAVPAVVAMGVAAIALTFLTTRLPVSPPPPSEAVPGPDRRRFLVYTAITAGVGLLALIGGQLSAGATRAADAARALFTLPPASVRATAILTGASLNVAGITPLITPNADFYRIDTALSVPRIDPTTWRLRITGMVENEVEIDFAELLALPLEESTTTLACVSNYVGGDLIGNAIWLGYPIRELLARAKPTSGADMVLSTSQDGFTAGTPISALTDGRNAILAVGMNGEPLPLEHGYPVRMVVPGLYGYVSATKWVVELKLTRFDQEQGYWTPRGWSELGPVKLSSRIDVPRAKTSVPAGSVVVAGVAWSQHVGVSAVAVQIDDGPWQDATLADPISVDTWRQWAYTWPDATAGEHAVKVRATDSAGLVQTSATADVAPNGATGLHEISVSVSA